MKNIILMTVILFSCTTTQGYGKSAHSPQVGSLMSCGSWKDLGNPGKFGTPSVLPWVKADYKSVLMKKIGLQVCIRPAAHPIQGCRFHWPVQHKCCVWAFLHDPGMPLPLEGNNGEGCPGDC